MAIQSVNPATGEVLETFAGDVARGSRAGAGGGARRLPRLARAALRGARSRSCTRRRRILRARKDELARTMTRRDGQAHHPGGGRGREVRVDLRLLRRARRAPSWPTQPRETDAPRSYVRFDPLGRRAGGHAVELPLLAGLPLRRARADGRQRRPAQARLERAALRARDRGGLPGAPASRAGLFRTVLVESSAVRRTDRRPAHRRRDAHRQRARGQPGRRAGRARAQEDRARARRQRSLHRARRRRSRRGAATAPPMPGSSTAARAASRPSASSWSSRCADAFLDALRRRSSARRRMGDPLVARHRRSGPQARRDLRDELHRAGRGVDQARGAAAPRRRDPAGPGAFYPPTVLAAVDTGMPAFDEETFGPVAAVIRAKDEADAMRLANDSTFGLGASLWTRDRAARRAARRRRSRRARSSSTAWSSPTRACPSAASSAPATGASSPSTASASS